MTSLRAVLAFNMKDHRSVLGITQAQLAERVNTSTNYIALIETQKKFPTPEMLERIAAALEIDATALFAPVTRRRNQSENMARLRNLILGDISRAVSIRFKRIEEED
jgi:transcriptional regulator with XRE-family HTH domain